MQNNFNKKLGLRIRELRLAKNIKQGELADILNMERSNLTRIESGKQRPNDDNIIKLAKIFGVEIKDLYDFEHTIKTINEVKQSIITNLDGLSKKELNYIAKVIKDIKYLR